MTHTVLDILLFVLFAGAVGFLIGQVWPTRLAFLSPPAKKPKPHAFPTEFPPLSALGPPGASGDAAMEAEKWRRHAARLLTVLRERDQTIEARDRAIEQLDEQVRMQQRLRDRADGGAMGADDELIRDLEARLRVQHGRYRDSERLRHSQEVELGRMRDELARWQEEWEAMRDELVRRDDALAELERALTMATAAGDHAADLPVDAVQELARLRTTAEAQQTLNAELMQSLQDRRRRILVLETELALTKQQTDTDDAMAAEPDASSAEAHGPVADPHEATAGPKWAPTSTASQGAEADTGADNPAAADMDTDATPPAAATSDAHDPESPEDPDDPDDPDDSGDAAEPQEEPQDTHRIPPPSASRDRDDLTRIRGIGRRMAQRLNRLGILRYEQLATCDDAAIDELESQDPAMRGRIRRERWVEQAADLALMPASPHLAAAGAGAAVSHRTIM
jgi:predicted flap endonuclease-1-like 5' DNA nuclease